MRRGYAGFPWPAAIRRATPRVYATRPGGPCRPEHPAPASGYRLAGLCGQCGRRRNRADRLTWLLPLAVPFLVCHRGGLFLDRLDDARSELLVVLVGLLLQLAHPGAEQLLDRLVELLARLDPDRFLRRVRAVRFGPAHAGILLRHRSGASYWAVLMTAEPTIMMLTRRGMVTSPGGPPQVRNVLRTTGAHLASRLPCSVMTAEVGRCIPGSGIIVPMPHCAVPRTRRASSWSAASERCRAPANPAVRFRAERAGPPVN